MASPCQSNFPVAENVMDNYADELEDSPGDFTSEDERSGREEEETGDFTPEDERGGGEEEETDGNSISLAEDILMKNKREKGKGKENMAPLALEVKLKQRENQEERQVGVKTGQKIW